MKIVFRKISVYSTIAYYYFRRRFKQASRPLTKWTYSPKAGERFEQLMAEVPSDKVFMHAGLSPLKRFTPGTDTYAYLKGLMFKHFKVVVSQGFTPVVRKTRIFDPEKERPAYGAFARLFFRDATYRNPDPCYSVMGAGEVPFDPEAFSFSSDGPFRQMVEEDFYCINVGLDVFTCSLLHYIEYEQQVPYLEFFEDIYYIRKGDKKKKIAYPIHTNKKGYSVKGYVWWNRQRLMKDLKKSGLLAGEKIEGVRFWCFSLKKLYDFVSQKVKNDPYYLIKW